MTFAGFLLGGFGFFGFDFSKDTKLKGQTANSWIAIGNFTDHPKVLRVVALSGGYVRDEANALLAKQDGMIASFSRALSEGLFHDMSDEDFDNTLGDAISSIYEASKAG